MAAGKNLLDFTGKSVLVTGGATGIGRAAALAFAEQGARLGIGDVDDRAEETVALINQAGGQAFFRRTDVRSAGQVEELVRAVVSAYGRLDCAFNNAGVLPPTQPLAETPDEVFDDIMSVDLRGVFLCMKAEIRQMLKSGGGAILNTASIAGVVADPGMSAYVAAKHGVIGLTKAGAIDYARSNIRINALAPGFVQTPMTQRWIDDPAFLQGLMANSPMGRAAQPEEITGLVLYLCSDLASFATGQAFIIDGAQTTH
jgi:NAD(P)-dependent dehydrogenase (short-subunit alcohol dehydrogenase family)